VKATGLSHANIRLQYYEDYFNYKQLLSFFNVLLTQFDSVSLYLINKITMLQRFQSIILGLIIVFLFIGYFVIANAKPFLFISMISIALLSIVTLLSFKKRKRQIALCKIGIVLCLLISVGLILWPGNFLQHQQKISFENYLFLGIVFLFLLAAYFIKKDDNLVKGADRLR